MPDHTKTFTADDFRKIAEICGFDIANDQLDGLAHAANLICVEHALNQMSMMSATIWKGGLRSEFSEIGLLHLMLCRKSGAADTPEGYDAEKFRFNVIKSLVLNAAE